MINAEIVAIAIKTHQDCNHTYDGMPYAVHLAMVYHYALKHIDVIPDSAQADVLHACWLHDVIEDCRMTYNDVARLAGEKVAEMVYAVTNEKGKSRQERANDKYYSGILEVPFARYVKLCDRLANVQYSKDSRSKMFEVYKQENDDFINKLFVVKDTGRYMYSAPVADLKSLFES